MTAKNTLYLIVRKTETSHELELTQDPIVLYAKGLLNPEEDEIYQVGAKLKLQVTLQQAPTMRGAAYDLKGGIGEYNG